MAVFWAGAKLVRDTAQDFTAFLYLLAIGLAAVFSFPRALVCADLDQPGRTGVEHAAAILAHRLHV